MPNWNDILTEITAHIKDKKLTPQQSGEAMDAVRRKYLGLLRENTGGLIFANLVDFDSKYGHRNDPKGYATALEDFDKRLPEITALLGDKDILLITADHGCDPTFPGTDHTREHIPLLVFGRMLKPGVNLGVRSSFSDMAATLGELWGIKYPQGKSFVSEILPEVLISKEAISKGVVSK